MYFRPADKVGDSKLDILASRVDKARDSQEEEKYQFSSTLDRLSSVFMFSGGDLEDKYRALQREYDRSESQAREAEGRIEALEDVARDLFAEWGHELDQNSGGRLIRSSEEGLNMTRNRYEKMIGAMKRAQSRIDPVLRMFKDQVLFLKHNLNAPAIAWLKAERGTIESSVATLIRDIEASIAEADAFVGTLRSESP